MLKVVGLDLSLRAFGVAAFAGRRVSCGTIGSELWPDVCGWARPARRRRLMLPLLPWLSGPPGTVLAVMEDRIPPVSINGWQGVHDRAEMMATVTDWLFAKRIPVAYIGPKRLKKYATGSGDADKTAMRDAARYAAGTAIQIRNDNEADAFWLMAAGVQHYGVAAGPVFDRVFVHALDDVDWPLWTQATGREGIRSEGSR